VKKRLELVTWRDAHFDADSMPSGDYLVKTVGWVDRKGRWLRIRSERLPTGHGWRAKTRVPMVNVVSRKRLRP